MPRWHHDDGYEAQGGDQRGRANGGVTLAGCQGAGMISPRMATLLVFILTDPVFPPEPSGKP